MNSLVYVKKLISFQALKYHVSRSTDLEPAIIIEKIILKLNAEKYRITSMTKNSVTFDNWKVQNWLGRKVFRIMDGGEFEINTSDNGVVVSFNYHLNTFPYLFILCGVIVISICQNNYDGIGFLLAFLIIAGVIQNMFTKYAGKEMLSVILTGVYR
jgi:hypothetical protein